MFAQSLVSQLHPRAIAKKLLWTTAAVKICGAIALGSTGVTYTDPDATSLFVQGSYTIKALSPTQIEIVATAIGYCGASGGLNDHAHDIFAEYDVGFDPDGTAQEIPPFLGAPQTQGSNFIFIHSDPGYGPSNNNTNVLSISIANGAPNQTVTLIEAAYLCAFDGAGTLYNFGGISVSSTTYKFGTPPFNPTPNFGMPRSENKKSKMGDPVDVVTGEFSQDSVDLHVNGPLPIEVRRQYSSQNPAANEFGFGWLSGYPSYLIVASDLSTIQASDTDGSVVVFERQSNLSTWAPIPADNPALTNSSGGGANLFNSTIISTVGGAGGYKWLLPDGSVRTYSIQQFNMGSLPYLTQCQDYRGNYLTFTYGADPTAGSYGRCTLTQSSNGTSVAFTYNAQGLLTQAAAADGRTVNYTYTYGGDLSGVQMPDGQNYSYSYGADSTGVFSNHLITKELKPDGRILENVYDSQGRVTQQLATVGTDLNPVVSGSYDYSIPNQTTMTDSLNHKTVYQYSGSLITKITDPLLQSITQSWYNTSSLPGNYPQSLSSVTDKRGLVTTFQYDPHGNVIQTQITGNLEGTGNTTSATATATYNSLNEPTSATDRSGITSAFSYNDSNYPHLPTQIVTSKGGVAIRTDQMTYVAQRDANTPATLFSAGLLAQRTVAAGGPYQTGTQFAYNTAGFLVQKNDNSSTSDPNVTTTFTYSPRGEMATVTDADGRTTSYTYDGMSRPVTKVVADETGKVLGTWTTEYDGSGEAIQIVGPRTAPANSEQWIYDGAGRAKQETSTRIQANANGNGITAATSSVSNYVHDSFGNLTSETDPLGNATTFTYDANGQILSKQTAGLRTESFLYEPGGNVSSYTSPIGGVTLYAYTATGSRSRQQNPDGSVLQWLYYDDGRVQKEILRNGSFWLITYDDVARTVTRVLSRSDGSTLATESDAYDPRGNLIGHTDVDGGTSLMTYDGLNRVKTATGPAATSGSAQRTVTTIYGPSAKTLVVQNGLSQTTTTMFDALGRPVQSQVKDAGGNSVRLTTYIYSVDNNSVMASQGSGAGAVVSTTYSDLAGRVLLTIFGDGTNASNAYDLDGNLISSTDPLGLTTQYSYNALNQAASQTLPNGTVTSFTYDAAGNLLTRAMAGGALDLNQTFDSAGRKLTESLVSGGASTRQFAYSYYPSNSPFAGLLQTTTAPRSVVTVAYDDFLRPQTISSAGALPETNTTTSYTFDNRGLATSVTQSSVNNAAGPSTLVSRSYDGYGNILSEAVTMGGQSVSSVSQTWDAAGRRASLNEAGSSLPAPLFAYQHRADGLLAQVAANNQTYSFSYADNGLIASRTDTFRAASIDSRDPLGRILQQTTSIAGTPEMIEDMTWRANSTLNTYAVSRTGSSVSNESRAYGYNSRGQLTSEGYSPTAGTTNSIAYTFDGNNPGLGIRTDAKAGPSALSPWEETATSINGFAQVTQDQIPATSSSVHASGVSLGADHVDILVDGSPQGRANSAGAADPVGAWSIDLNLAAGNHTLTANGVHPSGLYTARANSTFAVLGTLGGNVSNTFDADGNVVTRTWPNGLSQALTWDAFGRLVKVSQRDGLGHGFDWSAVYDGLGRRLQTTQQPVISGTSNGQSTVMASIYDPQIEFLEIGVRLNGAKAWKVYGPDLNGRVGSLQGTGGLEATIVDASGATQGVVNDQFGNGVASVTSGVATWFATRLGAYGPLPGTQAATLMDITQLAAATAWRGRRIDLTGFYDLGARYYEPTSGRFLSADPMGQAASTSLYDFAGGDPVNFFDPDGRCPDNSNRYPNGLYKPTEVNTSGAPAVPIGWGQNSANPQNEGYVSDVEKMLRGYFIQGPLGLAGGVYNLLTTNPVTTVDNVANALGTFAGNMVYNPATTLSGIADAFTDPNKAGQAWFNAATLALIVGDSAVGAAETEADGAADWNWSQDKGVAKSIRQMEQRGWTPEQVTEAIQSGEQVPAENLVNPGNPAIRYISPSTGQSVVQDTVTKEIIHFGGPGFKY